MTREEAIKHLTVWIYTDFDNMPKQVLEALNIALSALHPHQPGAGGEGVERVGKASQVRWRISPC